MARRVKVVRKVVDGKTVRELVDLGPVAAKKSPPKNSHFWVEVHHKHRHLVPPHMEANPAVTIKNTFKKREGETKTLLAWATKAARILITEEGLSHAKAAHKAELAAKRLVETLSPKEAAAVRKKYWGDEASKFSATVIHRSKFAGTIMRRLRQQKTGRSKK